MLVLSRKMGEQLCIGHDIRVIVLSHQGNKVRLGIEAPNYISVHRSEIYEKIMANEKEQENQNE